MERQRISSGSPYEPIVGFSRAVRVGDRVLVAGTAPIWPDGSCDPDPEVQAERCLEIILGALAEAGAGPEHVVRTRSYLVERAASGCSERYVTARSMASLISAAPMAVASRRWIAPPRSGR